MDRSEPWSRRARIWFLVGLVLAFVAAESAARLVGPSGSAQTILDLHRTALEDGAGAGRATVFFVGDSSTGAAIDPARFGALTGDAGYSLWLPNATPGILERLVVDFAFADEVTEESIDEVVIGVTARMFNDSVRDDRETFLRQLADSLPWQDRTGSGLYLRAERLAADRLALVRYRAGLRRPSDWYFRLTGRIELELTDRGQLTYYLDRTQADLGPDYESGERAALRDYRISDEEFAALHRLIDQLDELGIVITVVHLPNDNSLYDEFYPRGSVDQAAFAARLATELADRPVRLIDLTELGDQPELFADGNHLNRQGAERLTGLLAERIDG